MKICKQRKQQLIVFIVVLMGVSVGTSTSTAFELSQNSGADAKMQIIINHGTGKADLPAATAAFKWLHQAATNGDARAQSWLGKIYYEGKNYKESKRWYEAAAQGNDVNAQYNFGYFLLNGIGAAPDESSAAQWFEKAAIKGYTLAQLNLANMYWFGRGLTQNYDLAIKWYRKAANGKNTMAYYQLGQAYERGLGVEKNKGQAEMWYQKALDGGLIDARTALDRLKAA